MNSAHKIPTKGSKDIYNIPKKNVENMHTLLKKNMNSMYKMPMDEVMKYQNGRNQLDTVRELDTDQQKQSQAAALKNPNEGKQIELNDKKHENDPSVQETNPT